MTARPAGSEGPGQPAAGPPPEFVDAVRSAVEHIYDFDRLREHPLGRWLLPDSLPPGVSRAHALRQRLVDAIGCLHPGKRLSLTAKQMRASRILELRYIEALPFREVARTLVLSQPQYYREQQYALQTLTNYLWDTLARTPPDQAAAPVPGPRPGASAESGGEDPGARLDIETVTQHRGDIISLRPFLAEVAELLGPVAAQQHVQLTLAPDGEDVVATTSRTALRHAVLNALEYLLQQAQPASPRADPDGEIVLSPGESAALARIDLLHRAARTSGPGAAPDGHEQLELARQLVGSIGGMLRVDADRPDGRLVSLSFPARRLVLLAIEDNPSMVQLIARYVADRNYAVLSAGSVEEGLAAARSARPDVIILDIMLPHQDGWDALQALHHHPDTAGIPVVVCTVLAEQRLARALGATTFIRKPLARPALLAALEQCLSGPPPTAAGSPAAPPPPAASR